MTGYARKFEGNTTVSFKISDKQLLKKYNQIWKRAEKLLKIESDTEPVYGDNDKYIKTKIKIDDGTMVTNFQSKKNAKRTMQVFINNNERFCYQNKEKVLSSTLLEECKYEQEKTKMENFIDDVLY